MRVAVTESLTERKNELQQVRDNVLRLIEHDKVGNQLASSLGFCRWMTWKQPKRRRMAR